MTIVEFLNARLDEDEAVARQAAASRDADVARGAFRKGYEPEAPDMGMGWTDDVLGGASVLVGPERVLAEVEAKRRIVELHNPCDDWSYGDPSTCPELALLALPCADHPDYNPDWRP